MVFRIGWMQYNLKHNSFCIMGTECLIMLETESGHDCADIEITIHSYGQYIIIYYNNNDHLVLNKWIRLIVNKFDNVSSNHQTNNETK